MGDKKLCSECGGLFHSVKVTYKAETETYVSVCSKCEKEIEKQNEVVTSAHLIGCFVSLVGLIIILAVCGVISWING